MSNEALKELWLIADEIASIHMQDYPYNAPTCIHCDAEHDYKTHVTPHYESCPILKLERFKEKHKLALWATTHPDRGLL